MGPNSPPYHCCNDFDSTCHSSMPSSLLRETARELSENRTKEEKIREGIERKINRIKACAKKRNLREIVLVRWTHMSSEPEDNGCTLHTSNEIKDKYLKNICKENRARFRSNGNQVPSTYERNTGEHSAYATPTLYRTIADHKGKFRVYEKDMRSLVGDKKLVVVPNAKELYEKAGLNF